MPGGRVSRLQFPLGGLNRKRGFRDQPPFTSADLQNVRGYSTFEQRDRGGSRPGISKAFFEQIGNAKKVRLLEDLPVVATTVFESFFDNFAGPTLSSNWTAATWPATPANPVILPGSLIGVDSTNTEVATVHSLISMDTSNAYLVELFILPFGGAYHGDYEIFARMDNTTPDVTTGGLEVRLNMTGSTGAFTGDYTVDGGAPVALTGGTLGSVIPALLRVKIDGNNLTVTLNDKTLLTSTAIAAATGDRFGFGFNCSVAGGVCLADFFRVQHQTGDIEAQRTTVVASADGEIWFEKNFSGILEKLTTTQTLDADRRILAADRLSKLYIADYEPAKAFETDGTATGTTFDSASIPDWTTLGIDTDDDVLFITSAPTGTTVGAFKITTVAAGNLTLAVAPGDNIGITFRIERAPKVFDPVAETLEIWTATAGSVPAGRPLITRYRDRMVMAGGTANPIGWEMSRSGDPLDWDFGGSANDALRPIAGVNSDAGEVGQPITALISHSDDYLIFGCKSSLWIMRGDPAFNGVIDNLSERIGIVSEKSWTRGPNDEIIFLSHDGLYGLLPGGRSYPESISREILPDELRSVNSDEIQVEMEYDQETRGINIWLTPEDGTNGRHYFFDWQNKTFWFDQYPEAVQPFAALSHVGNTPDQIKVIFGGSTGFIRKFDRFNDFDDGTSIASFVEIGPIRVGNDEMSGGILAELQIVIGQQSGNITVELFGDETSEAVRFLTTALHSFTLSKGTTGLQFNFHRRTRASSYKIKLSNAEDVRWTLEALAVRTIRAGRRRRLST